MKISPTSVIIKQKLTKSSQCVRYHGTGMMKILLVSPFFVRFVEAGGVRDDHLAHAEAIDEEAERRATVDVRSVL